uniref:UPF0183 protein At3g51130 n=2 Tax=Hirondellea gigas TaxID=1518452 RepID=A0A6A7GCT3_9CRUS
MMFPIQPGASAGPFQIGMSLPDAITVIQKRGMALRSAKIAYNSEEISADDITISLTKHPIRFRFESSSQRLKLIDITNPTNIKLSYDGTEICGDNSSTFADIYRTFGPTFPGNFCPNRRIYSLIYPGIAALFQMPESYTHRDGVLPDSRKDPSPKLCRIFIFHGEHPNKLSLPPITFDHRDFQQISVLINRGIYLTKYQKLIQFGSTVQDVLSDLGRPTCEFHKGSDQMRIHSFSNEPSNSPSAGSYRDYFYNYFHSGLDILFDGVTHSVKKFILHTNLVGRPDFNVYHKCNFFIDPEKNSQYCKEVKNINSDSKWNEIRSVFGKPSRPFVRKHPVESFKSSQFYAFEGAVFEIALEKYIASLTLFEADSLIPFCELPEPKIQPQSSSVRHTRISSRPSAR